MVAAAERCRHCCVPQHALQLALDSVHVRLVEAAPRTVFGLLSALPLEGLLVCRQRQAVDQHSLLQAPDLAGVQQAQKMHFSRFVLAEFCLEHLDFEVRSQQNGLQVGQLVSVLAQVFLQVDVFFEEL